MGPVPPDEVGVPAQKGSRGDNQAQLAELASGQQPGQRGQDRAVSAQDSRDALTTHSIRSELRTL